VKRVWIFLIILEAKTRAECGRYRESGKGDLFFPLRQGLTTQSRLTSNVRSCFDLPNAGLTGMNHHTWQEISISILTVERSGMVLGLRSHCDRD
jgi:hypothetical protein